MSPLRDGQPPEGALQRRLRKGRQNQQPVRVDDLACPATTVAVLGFQHPTRIPCSDVAGHKGEHWFTITWRAAR